MSIVIGFLLGWAVVSTFTTIKFMNESLKNEIAEHNAEYRATQHLMRLLAIERELKKAEKDKTPAIIVIDKIKSILMTDKSI